MDLSEGGIAVLIGGKAKVGLPVKVQFTIGDTPIVMCGVVKGLNFDQKKNRSLLHVQAQQPSTAMANRILIYVFNLFGEREAVPSGRQPDARTLAAPTAEPGIPTAEAAEEESAVDLG
jgi:hypothetical protein